MYLTRSIGKIHCQDTSPLPLPAPDSNARLCLSQTDFLQKPEFPFFFFPLRKKKQNIRVKCHLVIRFSKPNKEFNTFRDGTEVKTAAEVGFFPPAGLSGEEMKVNSYCSNVK